MAEIPVEKKSGKSWLWILLALLLIGLLLWWLLAEGDDEDVLVEDAAIVEQVDGAENGIEDVATADAGQMTIANILANPSAYYGMDGFTADVAVEGPLTDRGFWIENDGSRMLAIIIDQPREVPLDINPGQQLSITGGTIRNPTEITDLTGVPLDDDTRELMSDQQAVLVVDESNIEITEGA